jgi:glycosyltransferase involved in cell wall biosynthesis
MRILHAPIEVAGQVGLSVFGLREIGIDARSFYAPIRFDYQLPSDYSLKAKTYRLRRLELAFKMAGFARQFDLFHFHYATSFASEFLGSQGYPDAVQFRKKKRSVVVEFWGSDVRLPTLEKARNPYYVPTQQESDQHRERLRRWAEITEGHAIIADHSFDTSCAPYFQDIHVVGQRIDTKRFDANPPEPENRMPLVVHAPSNNETKGTKFVRAAAESLKQKGLAFEYNEVSGLAHADALKIYSQADIIIDQLMLGVHGVLAAEAMALGKPVICYILPELEPTYPEGFPIINANPDTIESVLEEWIQRPEDRHSLGIRSREYAERVHDCRVVARKLVDAYEKIAAAQR